MRNEQKSIYFKVVGTRQITETTEITIELPYNKSWSDLQYKDLVAKKLEAKKQDAEFIINGLKGPTYVIEQLYSDKDCKIPFTST